MKPARSHRAWFPLAATSLLAPAAAVELAASFPADGAAEVPVSASIHLRFSAALDPDTLAGLQLFSAGGDEALPLRRATDLTQASITLAPVDFLDPDRDHELRGDPSVKSANGDGLQPFILRFRTSAERFEREGRLEFAAETFDRRRSTTTVLVGPDRRLYAADAFGTLLRWKLDPTGRPHDRQVLLEDPTRSRQYIDLEWDPEADADHLVLWVSYAERLAAKDDPRRFFTGTIARLAIGEGGVEERVLVTGLPHGRERQGGFETLPHQPNGLLFHDGRLYQSVGSTSSSGGPANWGVEEQPLSACILEIDYRRIRAPLDVHPDAGFDPTRPDAPLRVFATGIRNALELVAHSNGRLYTAVNLNDRAGRGDGVPDDPELPGDQNALIRQTTPDHESLLILERGRHYGFPNPARGHHVLDGGNPTPDPDPFEIADYPVGTRPEPGFAPELMFPIWRWGGTSPNGMLEYASERPHPLAGTLICCFYSAGDLAVMTLGSDGLPVRVEKLRDGDGGKLRFQGPLDITLDPASGSLYVADFGTQSKFGVDGSLHWLRPKHATAER